MTEDTINQKANNKYLIEFVLFSTYALFAMSWKAGDFLIASFGFSASQLAFMTNAINIAKIVGSLSAAVIIAKFGNRNTFAYFTILIIFGVCLTIVSNFSVIFAIRFILGLGGAVVLVTINPIVAKIFSKEELPIINGINAVAFNVGLAITLTFASFIVENPALTIKLISLCVFILLVLWYFISKDINEETTATSTTTLGEKKEEEHTMKDGLKDKFNWVFALSYSGLLGFYLVSFTFMDPNSVKYVIYAGVVGALVGTFNASKFKDQLMLVKISAFIQLLTTIAFIVFYTHPVAKLIGMALGFFIFFAMPSFVTLAFIRKDVTPRKIAVTFSIFWAVSYLASIFYIQTFAFFMDNMGQTLAFIFIVLVASSFFVGNMFFMKKEN